MTDILRESASPAVRDARRRTLAVAIAVGLVLIATVSPLFIGPAEFSTDDNYYFAENPRVTAPGLGALADIWLRPQMNIYFPVTVSSFAIEYALWGKHVKLYRLTNLLLFVAIALVAFSLARRLAGDGVGGVTAVLAVAVALLHPVNVESVAAASHRKELLYTLFGLLALHFFVARRRTIATVLLALLCTALSQLSKGSALVLPVLFVCYELLGRRSGRSWLRTALLLLPFFAVVAGLLTYQLDVASRSGVVSPGLDASFASRIGGVVRTASLMLRKFFFPIDIAFDYDVTWPASLPPITEWVLPALVLAAIAWAGFARLRHGLLLGLLALIPLAVYSNIMPITHTLPGQLAFYDHYLLFSTFAFAFLLCRGLTLLPPAWRHRANVGIALLLLLFAAYDFRLHGFWKTRETLYARVIETSPNLPKAYYFLGLTYVEAGDYERAKEVLRQVFTRKHWSPKFVDAYQLLGDAHAFSGEYAAAEAAYKAHLRYKPRAQKSLQNLAGVLIELGKRAEAQEVLERWRLHYPDDPAAEYNLQQLEKIRRSTPSRQ